MIIPATPAPAPRKFGIDVSKPVLLLFAEFSAVIAARPADANDVMAFSQELTEAVMSAFFGT